jgi:hypothetical protein
VALQVVNVSRALWRELRSGKKRQKADLVAVTSAARVSLTLGAENPLFARRQRSEKAAAAERSIGWGE